MNTMFLQHFAAGTVVQGTTGVSDNSTGIVTPYADGQGLSAEMRTYYSDYLIDNAEPLLVHDMFAQKQKLPKGAKTISFRKYDPLPKRTTPITEGVTPDGQNLKVSVVEATVAQYGGYVEMTDLLLMTAVDNNLCMATKLLGAQAGRTLDTISREVLAGGTNVQYAGGEVDARYLLVGGKEEGNHYITVDAIRRAVRALKQQNAEKIHGSYVAIIHPDVAYDLMSDPNWKYPHQYADPDAIYEGEIGKIEGVRFIESTEAKVFHAEDLISGSRYLVASADVSNQISVHAKQSNGLNIPNEIIKNRWVIVNGKRYFIKGTYDGSMILYANPTTTVGEFTTLSEGTLIYPGEAGAEGRDVYATIIMGENAYGTISLEEGGLEHIVKQLGSAGSGDPLNQRATVGWKASKVTTRLVEAFMVRIETTSSFDGETMN